MKDRTAIPARMKDLLTAYNVRLFIIPLHPIVFFMSQQDRICELTESGEDWIRDGSQGLYDVFEPTYLKASLMKEENLGHLIWGCDGWLAMGGKRWLNCPLDSYFSQRGKQAGSSFPSFLTLCIRLRLYYTMFPHIPEATRSASPARFLGSYTLCR